MFHACRKYSGIYAPRYPGRYFCGSHDQRGGLFCCLPGSSMRYLDTAANHRGDRDRGARTVSGWHSSAKMLASMHHRGSLVSYAGPDSIGAFNLLRQTPPSQIPESL